MTSKILNELEQLRQCLENPRARLDYHFGEAKERLNGYSRALDATESSVEKLSQTFDSMKGESEGEGEEGKDSQIRELRKLVAEKESSLECLRETVLSTKQSSESRIGKLQSRVGRLEEELRAARNEVTRLKTEKSELERRLEESRLAEKKAEKRWNCKERDLWSSLQQTQSDQEKLELSLEKEKAGHEKAKSRLAAVQREASLRDGKAAAEVARLKERLRKVSEKLTKAKKWLKAELQSREELEGLFLSLKGSFDMDSPREEEPDDPIAGIPLDQVDEAKALRGSLADKGRSIQEQIRATQKRIHKTLRGGR